MNGIVTVSTVVDLLLLLLLLLMMMMMMMECVISAEHTAGLLVSVESDS